MIDLNFNDKFKWKYPNKEILNHYPFIAVRILNQIKNEECICKELGKHHSIAAWQTF